MSPEQPNQASVRRQAWLIAVGVAVVTFACYSPALQFGWVDNWDDDHNFLDNESYRGLGWEQIRWAFTTYHFGPYQPLSWVTLGLDYEVWGMDARGYHLTNNLLHAASALVAFFVVARVLRLVLGGGANESRLRYAAAAGALVFSIHPLRVESVAWITERRDVLSGLFFLLTLLGYLRWCDSSLTPKHRWRSYGLAVACFLASMLSKATGMALPVALLVIDAYPVRRLRFDGLRPLAAKAVWVDKLPFFAITLWIAYLAFRGQQQEAAMRALDSYGLVPRIFQTLYGAWFYTYKTIVPFGLSPLYEGLANARELRFLLTALGTISVTVFVFAWRRRSPGLLASWLFFGIVASPVLGLVKVGAHLAADRYTYLPCLPWAALAGWAVFRVRVNAIVPIALLGVLGGMTVAQTLKWRDSETLWTHAVESAPNSALSRMLLGMAYYRHRKLVLAERHLMASFQLGRTGDPASIAAMADVHYRRGELDEAIEWCKLALLVDRNYETAQLLLQQCLAAKRGR